jgi:hypothetical protein
MLSGAAVVFAIPAPVGEAAAVKLTSPRTEGLQLQFTEWLEPVPEVNLFLHPGKTFPLTVKVTRDATLTFAVIKMALLKVAVVTDPARASELNEEVSTTSVTVIVMVCVPALFAGSVAVRTKS